MFISNILAQQGHELERLQVTAVSSFEKVGGDFRVTRMDLEVNGSVPGIDGPAFERRPRHQGRLPGVECAQEQRRDHAQGVPRLTRVPFRACVLLP